MGFLDKAKSQAQRLQETVTDKTSTLQRDRRADKLLEELGTLAFLELVGRAEPAHAARLETLRAELIQLEADGTKITWTPPEPPATAPAPPTGGSPPPPPPPPPPTSTPPPPFSTPPPPSSTPPPPPPAPSPPPPPSPLG